MTDPKADIQARKRKVDLDKISSEAADQLAEQIGQKIGNQVNELCEKIRNTLSVYGLDIKLTYIIHKVGDHPLTEYPDHHKLVEPEPEKKKRAPRKKKNEQSNQKDSPKAN